jgi:hypothetical protein
MAPSLGDDDLDAPVFLPPHRVVRAVGLHVRRDRPLGPEALDDEANVREPLASDEPVPHGLRAGFREPLIVGVVALRVGVAFDPYHAVCVRADDRRRLL